MYSLILACGLTIFPTVGFADGDEENEPEHSIEDAHEGVEGGELFAAGAGLIVALGIAFTVGRRSRKKD
jgi:hypothetical protein